MIRKLLTSILIIAICTCMSVSAHAAINPLAAMEAQSRQAVDAAVRAGTVPHGTTIYDCVYGADKNGVTIVIRYRDKSGNWIDAATGQKSDSGPATAAVKPQAHTANDLKTYADEVFRLVNVERVKAGAPPLKRSARLDEAAMARARDCASVNSLYVDGKSHTRPDGSRWFTIFGITKNYHYGENSGQGKPTAAGQMNSWLNSDGHRANILRSDYTEIGIACAASAQGETFAVQIFYRPV